MATSTSSKFDRISKKLICSGSPTLYQLNMKEEETGGVTKLTCGQKDLNKTNRTILLVGETGTGKSTLINALVNYAMGVTWEDNVWFKILDEKERKAQSESQTSDVIVYEIFGFEGETLPYSLTIIDTPGYGDTRGTEHDDFISKRLHDLFKPGNGVYENNVVGLVMKATITRLTNRSRYIFDSMVSLFGNNMEKNIVCLFTHSNRRKPKDALGVIKAAQIKCAKDENNEPVHFLFSNSQNQVRTEDKSILKQEEQRTTAALKKFSEFLEKAAPQNLMKTVEVLDFRIRLTACIQNLQERVQEIEFKKREVQQTQDALKKHEEEMERKAMYEKSKAECEGASGVLETLEKEMKKLQEDKNRCLEEVFEHVVKLEQIALNADSLSTHVHLDFLIEGMKEKGDTEKVKKLEEIKNRLGEDARRGLRYKVTTTGKWIKKTLMGGAEHRSISKKLIHLGSPTLYQLNMKKEKTGGVTKMTFGQKDPKSNRTILLVGETGTGKSTLINALTNYAMGVTWEDNVWFKIVDEEERKDQGESQTSDVIVYEIFGFEGETLPYSLTIIDTPGYGDTRGTERDDIVSKRLHDLFRSENGVHEINVVGLVLKASENRLTDRSRYIFDSVVSLFANDMEKNIVCLFTHSDGTEPENALGAVKAAEVKCAKDEMNEPVHFLFDNSQQKDRTENAKILKQAEERTTEGLKKFSEFLEKAAPQNLNKTVEVLDLRIRLTACIQNLQERVEEIGLKQKEVQQTQDALKKHEEEIKSNKNFTVEVDEVYKDKKTVVGGMWGPFFDGAVCCTVCEENCHYPGCNMAWSPKHCEVIKKGHCTVCSGECPVSDHVKEKWIYVIKTRKVQKTLQEVKEKYERAEANAVEAKAHLENLQKNKINQGDLTGVKETYETSKAECEGASGLLETLEMVMKKLQEDKNRCLEEAFEHVVKLEQIALNADSLSTHVHLDFLIERMKEKGDTEKVKKLEEIRKRLGEEARRGLRYKVMAAGNMFKKTVMGREELH